MKEVKVTQISMTEQPNPKEQRIHSLLLPFVESQGRTNVKNPNQTLQNNEVITHFIHRGRKLSSSFQIKDKANEKHKYDLIYYANVLNHPTPKTF